MKVSEYIAKVLDNHGINTVFSITGGFAMHMNDSFSNSPFKTYYQHHEQACGYSAVGYTKASGTPSVVCVTAGVAATNAISPCLVAYQDSVSVLFISGQVKHNDSIHANIAQDRHTRNMNIGRCKIHGIEYAWCAVCASQLRLCDTNHNSGTCVLHGIEYAWCGLCESQISLTDTNNINPRSFTFSDCDIVNMVSSITKYSHQISSVKEVKHVVETTINNLINGRPGPVWLSIPIDIQGMLIREEIPKILINRPTLDIQQLNYNMNNIYSYLKNSKRPIILAGNGVKLAGCRDKLASFINRYQIPVVTTSFIGLDVFETENPLFIGRIGVYGDRSGNFSIQNSDLIIVLGSSLCNSVVGYSPDTFARDAKILYIENDISQIEKPSTLRFALKLNMDLNLFFDNFTYKNLNCSMWVEKCKYWRTKWLFEMPQGVLDSNIINPYYALKELSTASPDNKIVVSSLSTRVINVGELRIQYATYTHRAWAGF
jgi:acetolactate synthase-1/2/3 large subunit